MRSTTFVEGVVVDTSDPDQMGRVKVWCPSIDGDAYSVENLPWVMYVSPLAGVTRDYPVGSSASTSEGPSAYGFWGPPKMGAFVVVGFMHGDINQRFYIGCVYPNHANRSLPTGRNSESGPLTDVESPIQPATNNLKTQFTGNLAASEAKTRGVYERQVAQARTQKDGSEGYQKGVLETGLDPQTYCWVTPGRHAIIMQDNPENGRVRIKTADGNQVILDDANERIYVSTAKGKTWIELDADGRVHIYGSDDIAVTSGGSINMTVAKDFTLQAGGNINLSAGGWLRASACSNLALTGDQSVNITSGGGLDILAAATILQTGKEIHLNGPGAAKAECPEKPTTIPQLEPWTRQASKTARNKNWKA